MNVLLLSMPDSFEHMPPVAIRIPNGALASLAGNLDRHHRVAIADLILVQGQVSQTITRLVQDLQPDVVGLSVMTFQRATAMRIAQLIHRLRPEARIVAGGYDPSLAPDAYEPCAPIEFLVRGEGERTFQALVRTFEAGGDVGTIAGLSHRAGGAFVHNPDRPVASLKSSDLRLPDRSARVLSGYTLLGRQADVIETSRGCTYDCSFCSIIEMRGRNFHAYSIERVLADIADARRHGARALFLVDDNITLDVRRFEALCQAIIDSGFTDIDYIVQAMTSPIAEHGARLAPLMRRAGFRYVFLGIENILDGDLAFLKAGAKNTRRSGGRSAGNATVAAIDHLHRHGMYVVGGLIVGNPDDTRESIEANLTFARQYVDWPYIQHPTPYPRTPMTDDFRRRDLIVDEDVAHYDGTTAVVRTQHVAAEDAEFLRWRADAGSSCGTCRRRAGTAPGSCSTTAARCSPTPLPARPCDRRWGWSTSGRCSTAFASSGAASATSRPAWNCRMRQSIGCHYCRRRLRHRLPAREAVCCAAKPPFFFVLSWPSSHRGCM